MPKQITPLKDRLMRKVEIDASGCWRFTGALGPTGYGSILVGSRSERNRVWRAHRAAYLAFRGPIPEGMHVLHRCDVRCCVNPDHLFLGTHDENMADRKAKGRNRPPRGERQHQARLTEEQVREIRARRARGERLNAIAADYGIAFTTVSGICTGAAWRHVQ